MANEREEADIEELSRYESYSELKDMVKEYAREKTTEGQAYMTKKRPYVNKEARANRSCAKRQAGWNMLKDAIFNVAADEIQEAEEDREATVKNIRGNRDLDEELEKRKQLYLKRRKEILERATAMADKRTAKPVPVDAAPPAPAAEPVAPPASQAAS